MGSGSGEKERFAFVIPVYNHADTVAGVIEGARKYNCPIIVVNDGSTDSTAERLKQIPGICLLSHEKNRGKGAAMLTGFVEAVKTAAWAITIDADGQHDPEDADTLIAAALENPHAIIVGRRKGMKEQQAPWTSRFGRVLSNFWVMVAGGKWLSDSQTGFRVYPLPLSLNLGVASRRFQFEVEVLVRSFWNNVPVIEKPVRVKYKRDLPRVSHFRPFVDFWRDVFTFTRLIIMRILIPLPLRRKKDVRG